MENTAINSFFTRIEKEISNYLDSTIEISEGVTFSQYQLIKRIYKFRNRNLGDGKINSDLSYNYYYDIISPRTDSEIKNLRFDTKHILIFSRNPRADFAAVFLANASLKDWMAENAEDEKLKSVVEEFVANGNVGFKKVDGGYEKIDVRNTYITNQRAENVNDTDIIERHTMTASRIKKMEAWNQEVADNVIKDLGDLSFGATARTTKSTSTSKHYEIFEFTGEVSEMEFNAMKGLSGGDEHTYFLAKVLMAGLKVGENKKKYILFAEKLTGQMSDYYLFAHRGRYEGRFWRVGMYELLFDHQIRANEIGNQLARGLEWASKVIFRSKDSKVLQNIRADLDNGDVVIAEDLSQLDVRLHNLDQLIADWNRLMTDTDRLANSYEVVRGENPPSGTPFRSVVLTDQNAGKLFILHRQKITLPFKRVFREWVLPELLKKLKGQELFRLVNDQDIIDQFKQVMVDSWYIKNLVAIGPHTREMAEAIKEEKMKELEKIDPVIENTQEIWKDVRKRLFVTITGENSDIADNVQDLINIVQLEKDPARVDWILDMLYKIRGIPVPPKRKEPVTPQPQPSATNQNPQEMMNMAGQPMGNNAGAPQQEAPIA